MKANSKYLTLALDVRRITDSLIRLAEDGSESQDLSVTLRKVLASLSEKGDRTAVQRLRESGSFGTFDGQRTVREVFESTQTRQDLIGKIQVVLDSPRPEERKKSALAAIPLLDALERRALYRYNRPQAASRVTASR